MNIKNDRVVIHQRRKLYYRCIPFFIVFIDASSNITFHAFDTSDELRDANFCQRFETVF